MNICTLLSACILLPFHPTLGARKPLDAMWSRLPLDLLANVFSFLSPDSLARASSACRHWNACAKSYTFYPTPSERRHHLPWFVALSTRRRGLFCYAHNPITDNWHLVPLDFVPDPVRPIAPINGLVLVRATSSTALQLAICNPFTRQYKPLPLLNTTRTNPAVGVVELGQTRPGSLPFFKIHVAGGMSEAPGGGATYEPTLEMYDSRLDTWRVIGSMPVEFAVRLTVWTPNESVYSNGVIYWMTSARAYSVMAFKISTNAWTELTVPLADRLEFAALVRRNGKLTLVGGAYGEGTCIWELGEDPIWSLIDKVPVELGARFLGESGSWGSTKCVGVDGAVWLYRDLGSGMVVWREDLDKAKWEWFWVDGCCYVRGKQVGNFPIKGVVLHPILAPSHMLNY